MANKQTTLVQGIVQLVTDIQFHHWNTTLYSEHKALDFAYDELSGYKDSIAEKLIGYYGRLEGFKLASVPSCSLKDTPTDIIEFGSRLKAIANEDKHTDLDNIGDEIIAVGSELKYLLTLS